LRKFGSKDINPFDGRWLYKEPGRFFLQRMSEFALEVGFPASLVWEGVEDAER
jgi:hypothetical protein